jgi:hypothetical protein
MRTKASFGAFFVFGVAIGVWRKEIVDLVVRFCAVIVS